MESQGVTETRHTLLINTFNSKSFHQPGALLQSFPWKKKMGILTNREFATRLLQLGGLILGQNFNTTEPSAVFLWKICSVSPPFHAPEPTWRHGSPAQDQHLMGKRSGNRAWAHLGPASPRFIMLSTQTKLIYFWRLLVWNGPDLNVWRKQEAHPRELAVQVQKVDSVLFHPISLCHRTEVLFSGYPERDTR